MASISLLGDSWLAGTYNPNATKEIADYTGAIVSNAAIDSNIAEYVLWQVTDYFHRVGDIEYPATAIIDIGLPDFFNGITQDQVKRTLLKIVDVLKARHMDIILSCPADVSSHDELSERIANGTLYGAMAMCIAVRDYSNNRKFLTIVDLQSRLMIHPELKREGDCVHLNNMGFAIFNFALATAYSVKMQC
jgi:hypothetical protein